MLVVEQNGDLRSALREMLEAEGCVVSASATFEDALDALGRADGTPLLLVGLGRQPRRSAPALSAMRDAGARVVAFSALPRSALPHDLPVETVLDLPFTVGDLRGAIAGR